MSSQKYDIAVIGSGPGGFAAAVRAAQLGAKVALVEKSEIGGTCLNCGCIPTKFLWQALNTKQKIQKSYDYGFKATLEPFSFADIIAKKDKLISNIRKGMDMILSSYGIEVLKGEASFKNKNTLLVDQQEITADKIIIASGSKSSEIKNFPFDGNKVISSTDVLDLQAIPKTILVIGGGSIGVEMSAILAGFGAQVTLAEYESCVMPSEDSEVSAEITKGLQKLGVEVMTSCSNALDNASKYEKVLIVTGRAPNNNLKLENAGIETFGKGFIKTNAHCQTNIESIYAIGDITGEGMLAYTAQYEGEMSAENAVKGNALIKDDKVIPQVVFSVPPAASVKVQDFGKYKNVLYGKFPWIASGRAFIENERSGFAKCAVDADTKKPLGFLIVGAHADELINTAAQIIKTCEPPLREMFFHPSLSESLYNAYEDAFGKCTEKVKTKS